jgi:hypothetical protein
MRRDSRLNLLGVWLLACTTLLSTRTAKATLGQTLDSLEKDRQFISGERNTSRVFQSYTVHRISKRGLEIREYAQPNGPIFGLAWSGTDHPDLTQLMGDYFDDYQAASKDAAKSKVRVRSPFSRVEGQRVTVEKFGHMRAVSGRACVSELLPTGVTCDVIR